MSDDIFDTRFEDKEVEIDDGFVNLGDEVNLLEKNPSLHNLRVGMGWEANTFDGDALDLDVSLFLLDKNEQTRIDEDFIFYNNMRALDGAIVLHGDSRAGAGEGDDEMISIDLHGVPFDVWRIVVFLSIYQGVENEQGLGLARQVYLRLVDESNNHELCRFDMHSLLRERPETGVVAGFIDREGPKWHFRPAAEFYQKGLEEYAQSKGLTIIQS